MFQIKRYDDLTGLEKVAKLIHGFGPEFFDYFINKLSEQRLDAISKNNDDDPHILYFNFTGIYYEFLGYIINGDDFHQEDGKVILELYEYYSSFSHEDFVADQLEGFSQEELEEIIDIEPSPDGEAVVHGPVEMTEEARWERKMKEKVVEYCFAHPDIVLSFIDKLLSESGL